MNERNLVPMNQRTKSEQREIAGKGGLKSGETRRRNRDIKKIVAAIMQAAPDAEMSAKLREQGIDERDITNKTAMVYSLYEQAMKGNVKAFEALMKYSGEDPEQQRKDTELQMKRDSHILILNDKDYSGFDPLASFAGDDEKSAVLISLQGKYKELSEAHKRYESSHDDDDDDDDFDLVDED